MSIKVENFAKEISGILDDYGDTVNSKIITASETVAKECVSQLKSISPSRTKKYAKSWTMTKRLDNRFRTVYVVHNKKFYRLTHLLENGHVKKDGDRVKAYPHISLAEEQAVTALKKRIEDTLK